MREQSVSSRLRKAGFADPSKAGRLLDECAQHGIDPPPVEAFARAASPDQCLLLLTRLAEACSDKQAQRSLLERKITRLNSRHIKQYRMPSYA